MRYENGGNTSFPSNSKQGESYRIKTVCRLNQCNGCMACISACPKGCISVQDSMRAMNAVIDEDACIGCHLCERVCPDCEIQVRHDCEQVRPDCEIQVRHDCERVRPDCETPAQHVTATEIAAADVPVKVPATKVPVAELFAAEVPAAEVPVKVPAAEVPATEVPVKNVASENAGELAVDDTTAKKRPILWKQGWADPLLRADASSGGAASAIMKAFMESGGYVASCIFQKGEFRFILTNSTADIRRFAGSKYVKSNPSGIYPEILKRLETDPVLFAGLPCQVAAVKKYCQVFGELSDHHAPTGHPDLQSHLRRLYTMDLVCHGTPSSLLLDRYLKENNYNLTQLSEIGFRKKEDFGLRPNGKKLKERRVTDAYTCAFLKCMDYTENCYSCAYALLERTGDLTLGDAWGTDLSEEKAQGISLILVQNEKGRRLVEGAGLKLSDISLLKAVENNQQLSHPSKKPSQRDRFFRKIEKGRSFRWAAFCAMPGMILKQKIKWVLVKCSIF